MVQFGIYKWTNLITGRALVGQAGSTTGFKRRRSNYVNALKKGTYGNAYFQRSWDKHGEANFRFEVIQVIGDDDLLTKYEQLWVDHYRELPGGVYNDRGPVDAPRRGAKVTEESKQKWRETVARNGGLPPHTAEALAKMSLTHKGRKLSPEHVAKKVAASNKAVERVDVITGEVKKYASVKAAADDGFDRGTVSATCNGKRETYDGFFWQFADGVRATKNISVPKKYRRVERVDVATGEITEYESMMAAEAAGFSPAGIRGAHKGRTTKYAGFFWNLPDAGRTRKPSGEKRFKKVERVDPSTGEIKEYASAHSTEPDGFRASNISAICNGKGSTHRGFYWRFADSVMEAV